MSLGIGRFCATCHKNKDYCECNLLPRVQRYAQGCSNPGRCQVFRCGKEAKFICMTCRKRYCGDHYHPHYTTEKDPKTKHVHKRYKYPTGPYGRDL